MSIYLSCLFAMQFAFDKDIDIFLIAINTEIWVSFRSSCDKLAKRNDCFH